jgi:hypothetical protein
MDPLAPRVAARFAGEVVHLVPKPQGPKVEIGARHYVLSTDSGPLAGDLEERIAPPEGGARIISPPPHANKWRYLWAYDTEAQVLAMWRVSDGDEKVYENAKSAGGQIARLDRKKQLNRVPTSEFRAIEAWMKKRTHETIEELKRVVEDNKDDAEKTLDTLVKEYFAKHVEPLIVHALANIQRGATPIGFKPYDSKAEHVSVERQASVFVISNIVKRQMTDAKVETWLRQHKFDLNAIHNQAIEWAIADVRDVAFEKYLPPR